MEQMERLPDERRVRLRARPAETLRGGSWLVGRPHSRLRVAPTLGDRSRYLPSCLGGEFARGTSENVVRQTSAQRVRFGPSLRTYVSSSVMSLI